MLTQLVTPDRIRMLKATSW